MVVELPKMDRVGFIIVFSFLSLNLFLFNSASFAQSTADCTQVQCVKILDGKLMVYSKEDGTYKPYFIKSVGYSPTPIGRHVSDWGWPDANDPRNNNNFDDPAILNRDFAKLQLMHANTIRLWKGNDTQEGVRFPNKLTARTVNLATQYNLKIIPGFWVNDLTFDSEGNVDNRQDTINRFVQFVNNFKQYPAILFWAIGNENNYNKVEGHPLTPQQLTAWYALVNDMARAAHDAEGAYFHPVAIVNGEIQHIGDADYGTTDEQMPALDIWGANVYRGLSFGTLFTDYQRKSQKPLWISEFSGADAWHVNNVNDPSDGYEDQNTQSKWVGSLWDEIVQNAQVTIGGTVMEYSDEWWKPSEWYCVNNNLSQEDNAKLVENCNSAQHHFGYKSGSFPDGFSSEQWFGIMSIARNPEPKGPDIMKERKVYYTLQEKWQSNPADSQQAADQKPEVKKVPASEVVLKSGQKLEGNIVTHTNKYIKLDMGIGVLMTYYSDEINTVNGQKL